jgi:hypothetical protein
MGFAVAGVEQIGISRRVVLPFWTKDWSHAVIDHDHPLVW